MGEYMNKRKLVIIGGGPAGLAAAMGAREAGVSDILILERDDRLGGILNQCIHNGFGLHTFKEELTGPEYASRFIDRVKEAGIEYRTGAMVTGLKPGDNGTVTVTVMGRRFGLEDITAGAVILAMGCRERSRGALNIPGYRPAGIYTAGTAQRFVNIEGRMPGKDVIILGSGDIGLIMARRMTLEGAKVHLVAELNPYSGGLKRNIAQCLNDFDIPLMLSHTVVDIKGRKRIESVTIAEVDEKSKPIPGSEKEYPCDTLLLSCGLIPENELTGMLGASINPVTGGPVVSESLMTDIQGVFACGNVLHVHDLVDYVSEEAAQAGKNAAAYLNGALRAEGKKHTLIAKNGVRYTVPASIDPGNMEDKQIVRFRVGKNYRGATVKVTCGDEVLSSVKRPVMAPGEMEQVILKKEVLTKLPEGADITFEIVE